MIACSQILGLTGVLLLVLSNPCYLPLPKSLRLATMIQHCEKLRWKEFTALMDKLGEQKDFDGLAAIWKSKLPNAYYAVGVYAGIIDDEDAVRFCTRWRLGSQEWAYAFSALDKHRKSEVIGYIKQVATSRYIEVRAFCYLTCGRAGWDDLVSEAKRDAQNEEMLEGPGWGICYTLGRVARDYMEDIANRENDKRKERGRRWEGKQGNTQTVTTGSG